MRSSPMTFFIVINGGIELTIPVLWQSTCLTTTTQHHYMSKRMNMHVEKLHLKFGKTAFEIWKNFYECSF